MIGSGSFRLAARFFLVVVLPGSSLLAPAKAQQSLTQVDGRFECSTLENQQECAMVWEKRFLASHPGLVAKDGHILKIRLSSGRTFKIDGSAEANNIIDLAGNGRFLIIRRQHYEGNSWDILDLHNGVLKEIYGYPLFSPDQTKFVAASIDLEAQWSDIVLDLYRITPRGIAPVFKMPRNVAWGPRHVRWQSNDAVAFALTTLETSGYHEQSSLLMTKRGRWSIVRQK
jgi:hypothetical protein